MDTAVVAVAEAHGVTPAQAVLRRHVQLGALPVPKSADAERQRANLDLFGFALDAAPLAAVSERSHRRPGGAPDRHEEFRAAAGRGLVGRSVAGYSGRTSEGRSRGEQRRPVAYVP